MIDAYVAGSFSDAREESSGTVAEVFELLSAVAAMVPTATVRLRQVCVLDANTTTVAATRPRDDGLRPIV